jgi:hypothetical protein
VLQWARFVVGTARLPSVRDPAHYTLEGGALGTKVSCLSEAVMDIKSLSLTTMLGYIRTCGSASVRHSPCYCCTSVTGHLCGRAG